MLRRPEQVCFCPSTSLDAPNKFVFAEPKASTPQISLFLPIHRLRRSEQVCFSRSTSFDAPNKFVFADPRASTLRTKTAGAAASDIEGQAAPGTSTSLWHGQLYTRLSDVIVYA